MTRLEDARLAVSLGAWAVGFVFWPRSPRVIEPDRARDIIAALPEKVMTVGVFVDQPAEFVREVVGTAHLGAVQLHGDESSTYARQLGLPVIKALTLTRALDGGALAEWNEATILLDADDPARHGGTGRTIDWTAAAMVARRRPVVLAGGLTPVNVAEAFQTVRPSGIDVSSGIERAPGEKDATLMAAFFDAIAGVTRVS